MVASYRLCLEHASGQSLGFGPHGVFPQLGGPPLDCLHSPYLGKEVVFQPPFPSPFRAPSLSMNSQWGQGEVSTTSPGGDRPDALLRRDPLASPTCEQVTP